MWECCQFQCCQFPIGDWNWFMRDKMRHPKGLEIWYNLRRGEKRFKPRLLQPLLSALADDLAAKELVCAICSITDEERTLTGTSAPLTQSE